MAVFCVHSVLELQRQQLDLQEACSWAVTDQGKRLRSVREGGMDRPSQHKSHPAGLILLQPARRGRVSVLGHLSSLRPHWVEQTYFSSWLSVDCLAGWGVWTVIQNRGRLLRGTLERNFIEKVLEVPPIQHKVLADELLIFVHCVRYKWAGILKQSPVTMNVSTILPVYAL